MPSAVILDTCALIWLAEGSGPLSPATLQRIDDAPTVYVSAISAWEVSLKSEKGDLELPLPAEAWFLSVLEVHELSLFPLSPEILMAANRLPWHHRDPADRFIIATAQKLQIPVVTTDRRFSSYACEVIQ
jgi:PIN domain nuclease of toxin-antitoxin system